MQETADYVEAIIAQHQTEEDEFHLKECKAGELADQVAAILVADGYQAYSQSDHHLIETRVDVHKCITCLKCLVHCPYIQRYVKSSDQMKNRLTDK